ncbi:MAG TPA: glycoside hydrolase family 36 protein [Candidatus Sulfotelmatobacter sp.]|nr:glycoside hydrolase family 36 protein [Candidatus Sulfotelmatobacter sp.]
MSKTFSLFLIFTALLAAGQSSAPPDQSAARRASAAQIQSPSLRIEFDKNMRSRVVARFGGKEIPLGAFSASETVKGSERSWYDFALSSQTHERATDTYGAGEKLTLMGISGVLNKNVSVTIYDEFPNLAVFDVSYTNVGKSQLKILEWTNNHYTIDAQRGSAAVPFWSFQSGSYESRPDWIVPLHAGFSQQNYLGMNASDYGGGTPIVDVWRRDAGIGVGHVESRPRLISLPVSMLNARQAQVSVQYRHEQSLQPGDSFHTFRTFVTVHNGDYFQTLLTYRRFMSKQGFQMAKAPDSAFGAIWCAWGYGRDFKPQQVYDTLPTVKRMGFTWVTLDDGWQNNYGDWQLDPKKFPHGDADIKAMVKRIHQEGFKAQLWWSPLSAVPNSKLLTDEPDLALENQDGSRRKISWWNSYYLCPANSRVVEYHKELVRKILVDWGFDGLKLDGQHMNGVPACYNPAHHHKRPEDSVEALPDFFREIYDAAQKAKPGALVEFCPCGTAYSFFTMPHFNMSVASDPRSSFQVRSKGKTIKGLMGDDVPYFGDHVELSDNHDDFASTLGIGGVVGTQFVLPPLVERHGRFDLTPDHAESFQKWLELYQEKGLSRGQYLGTLYDIGFDRPEAHVIRKDKKMYYAFFAGKWKGTVELRGLDDRAYHVVDYAGGKDFGVVRGPVAHLPAEFSKHLLLEATPQ